MVLDPAFGFAVVVFFFAGLVVDVPPFYSWPTFLDGGKGYLCICLLGDLPKYHYTTFSF
jgi:hypothetical protein